MGFRRSGPLSSSPILMAINIFETLHEIEAYKKLHQD